MIAKSKEQIYVKGENEDFITLLSGIMGPKKRIHIQVNKILTDEVRQLKKQDLSQNEKLSKLSELIDHQIWKGYKLWPSNYIAYDLLHQKNQFASQYTAVEKASFEKRLSQKVNQKNPLEVENFLQMYAHPVVNQLGL